MKHYPFGSSTAARTDACTRWFTESEGVPRQESSYAIDGTIIHGVLEAIALAESTPVYVDGHEVTAEHAKKAGEFWDELITAGGQARRLQFTSIVARGSEDVTQFVEVLRP